MGIPKFMGIETEYNIYSNKGDTMVNAMIGHLRGEPLGLDRRAATPTRCFLINGGLVYKDMGAPEYCTPECPCPKSLVIFDKAGESIIQELARSVSILEEHQISIYKKASDGYGNSSGCHENYSITPELFSILVNAPETNISVSVWSTFLALRQLITGGGKIGSELSGMPATFQISQRSDFILSFRNNQTISDRPVIQCRDEAWAKESLAKRLHVIVGDPNLCEWALFLKVGLSALILMALEDGYFTTKNLPVFKADLPKMFHLLSRDIRLVRKYNVVITNSSQTNRVMSATEMLKIYIEVLANYLSEKGGKRLSPEEYATYQDVIEKARFILSKLVGNNVRDLFGICDWTTKLILTKQFLGKRSKTLADCAKNAELELDLRTFIDMGYGSMDPTKSLYHNLVRKGHIRRITSNEEINSAILLPPQEGRAPLRVAITNKFPNQIKSIFWDKVILFDGNEEFTLELPAPFVYNAHILKDAITASRTPGELRSVWSLLLREGGN